MKSFKGFITFKFVIKIAMLIIMLMAWGCLPQQARVFNPDLGNSNVVTENSNETSDTETTSKLPESVNFLQLGTQTETSTLSIFADYKDTFLIRGNEITKYLSELDSPFETKFCIATKFKGTKGSNVKEVLILAARARSFVNYSIGGNEFYLQMDVANEAINSADCMTASLINALNNKFSSTNFALNISSICPECNSSISSDELFIYSPSGAQNKNISINQLRLTITPALGSTSEGSVTCSNNAGCASQGFNCCLNGQCVNHGEVKEGVDTSSDDYLIAYQKVLARPELINNYQDVFYICPEMVPTVPDNNPIDPNLDPVQQAADQFHELNDLYNCLNPVLDEYSICTKEFENASKLINDGGQNYSAAVDDLTFKGINGGITFNNIREITYGRKILFKEGFYSTDTNTALDPADGSFVSSSNDNFLIGQTVNITAPLASDATDDTLRIRYLVDGTCERLGSSLARCKKYYTQGQNSNPARPSDHSAGSTFLLPSYANLTYNLIVEVDGVRVAPDSSTWSVSGQAVQFNATKYPIYTNQKVAITYFVSQNIDLLLTSKGAAQEKVNSYCACDESTPCNLKPVTETINNVETVTNYMCSYPVTDGFDPPLRETVFVSAKTAPHKFFDVNGVYSKNEELSTADEQEGTAFEYIGNNTFKPNNIDQYVGFNEIHGTFNQSVTSSMPATVLDVVKGRRYDLWTEEGTYSSCINCGTDYFTSLNKIFPGEFLHKGGGYLPDMVESRRTTTQGDFRADDLLYGRGCFVPATMIPWTHQTDVDVTTQRRNRLAAQHFLFANGYNRDWFGFDYGSVIGSFDGVTWFSVGNARRVQATSNKLYLAVNAYYGDLTTNNTFKIVVNETTAQLLSGVVFDPDDTSILFHDPDTVISTDLDSYGAQCQRFHLCETDNDCLTRLGYDYVCSNVTNVKTPWPSFDSYGREISGSKNVSLFSLFGGSNGFTKRCVYRGKGAPCETNAHNLSQSSDSYASTMDVGVNTCSTNNYCEQLSEDKFNTKIARYGESVANQNNKSYVTPKSDLFGLTARILGRPLKFYGDEEVPSDVKTQLDATKVKAICIPGKDIENTNTVSELNYVMTGDRKADVITNIGITYSSKNENYFAACPGIDNEEEQSGGTGSYTYLIEGALNNNLHKEKTIAQNMSTNSLDLAIWEDLDFYNDDDGARVDKIGYHKNTCLRSPGASCFTDFDCSANSWIATKVKTITDFNTLNEAEQNFWQEELICGGAQNRYNNIVPNDQYDLRQHKCCRETGKSFTFYSQTHQNSDFDIINTTSLKLKVPGVDIDIDSPSRYSRVHTIYDKVSSDPTKYPAPLVPATGSGVAQMNDNNFKLRQYNTLHLNNSRMCCTGNWVRNFASGDNGNGGGHRFTAAKGQNFNDIEVFKTLNWGPLLPKPSDFPGTAADQPYVCDTIDSQSVFCEIRSVPEDSEADLSMLRWFSKFELLGIPQVLIETDHLVYKPLDDDQKAPSSKVVFDGTIHPIGGGDPTNPAKVDVVLSKTTLGEGLLTPDINSISGLVDDDVDEYIKFYSAGNPNNFDLGGDQGFKNIFDANKFNCCLPTGVIYDTPETTSNDCCTGFLMQEGSNQGRCCLPDYTDVSVYTNRYVSSEGVNFPFLEIDDDDVDPVTGEISRELVLQMAGQMCCSGQAAYGKVIGELMIPLLTIPLDDGSGGANGGNPSLTTRRWLYKNTIDAASDVGLAVPYFKEGQKWNNHVYCVPGDNSSSGGGSATTGGAATSN